MSFDITAMGITASDLHIVLSESFPNASYGAIPIAEQRCALESYFGTANNSGSSNRLCICKQYEHPGSARRPVWR